MKFLELIRLFFSQIDDDDGGGYGGDDGKVLKAKCVTAFQS